jgi:hypothetical protein
MPATIALLRPAPRPGDVDGNKRSIERPVLVCNRNGVDVLDFAAAPSIVAADGPIVYSPWAADPAWVLVDWNSRAHAMTNWRVAAAEE